ncbi:MAG: hypothetical protein SGJ16_11940 [Nitrospirota bacterium]|nr:hypothetical protein [Nitrospirota bacterium]
MTLLTLGVILLDGLSIRKNEYAASKLAGLFTLAKFTFNAFPGDSGFASVVTVRDCVAVNISWGLLKTDKE